MNPRIEIPIPAAEFARFCKTVFRLERRLKLRRGRSTPSDDAMAQAKASLKSKGWSYTGEWLQNSMFTGRTWREYSPENAKRELKKRGHTYRSAAPIIGRSYQWICQVLNGQTTSGPVLRAVFELPTRPNPKAKKKDLA